MDREGPDVVLTDIRMPPTHTDEGLRAALTLRRDHPDVALLVAAAGLGIGGALVGYGLTQLTLWAVIASGLASAWTFMLAWTAITVIPGVIIQPSGFFAVIEAQRVGCHFFPAAG